MQVLRKGLDVLIVRVQIAMKIKEMAKDRGSAIDGLIEEVVNPSKNDSPYAKFAVQATIKNVHEHMSKMPISHLTVKRRLQFLP